MSLDLSYLEVASAKARVDDPAPSTNATNVMRTSTQTSLDENLAAVLAIMALSALLCTNRLNPRGMRG